jgi:hypothetical protein
MKFEFFGLVFEKISNTKFHRKQSVQWEPSRSMRKEGEINMTKLIVDFRNFCERAKTNYFHRAKRVLWKLRVTVRHCTASHSYRRTPAVYIAMLQAIASQKHSRAGKIQLPFPDPTPFPREPESNSEKFQYHH